jgi:chaperonin GroES
MTFPIQPIQDRLICRTLRPDQTFDPLSGIFITEELRDDWLVVAVGPGRLLDDGTRRPPQIKVGERAVYHSWRGQHFDWESQRLTALAEDDLIGRIDENGEFHPLNGLLICHQLPTERKVGMILLPSVTDDRDEAIVDIIGCDLTRRDGSVFHPELKIGDRVLYHKRMGMHFRLFGKEMVAFEERFVFCLVDSDVFVQSESLEPERVKA